jgi:hypothetical protein
VSGDEKGRSRKKGLPTIRGIPDDPSEVAVKKRDDDESFSMGADFEGGDLTALSAPPFVEVELSYLRGHAGMPTEEWKAVEVWTRNRIYVTDWSMKCIEVIDRETGKPDLGHALLGSVLAGGQKSTDDGMEMTYPLPRPDTEAVFEYQDKRKGYVSTSTVTRVIVRLRVLTVPRANVQPTWESITGAFQVPGARKQR